MEFLPVTKHGEKVYAGFWKRFCAGFADALIIMPLAFLLFSEATGGKEKVREWLNAEDLVLHWRTDLPNMFYVISEATAAELSESLSNHIGRKGRFLLSELGENRQGLLP